MYENGNITVDDSFARFGGKSFAINKINSVEVRENTTPGSRSFIFWWLLTALLVVAAGLQQVPGLLVLAFLPAFMGWLSWRKMEAVTTYKLFLVTSSSEAQAFMTNDLDAVVELRLAIEDAIARSN